MKIPEGYEIDEDKSTFVFKKIKKELPKSWEELEKIKGYYVEKYSKISNTEICDCNDGMRNIFKTKEQAEASIALAQLSQLIDVYRDGWIPDWVLNDTKFIIYFYRGILSDCTCSHSEHFLSFQNAVIRTLFLENFRDLIEKAKPLIS